MSMLGRYKKAGGFLQLVKLLEGFGVQKREKFLEIIEQEDSVWAEALKGKLLTVDRIFSWGDNQVLEIISRMHHNNAAAMLMGLDDEKKNKVFSMLSHSEKRRLEGTMGEMNPSPGEIATSMMKFMEEAREMIAHGMIRLENVDPDLIIDEGIEENLTSAAHFLGNNKPAEGGGSAPLDFKMAEHLGADGASMSPRDIATLKTKVVHLTKENNVLKRENATMKSKLEQIKKIA